MAHIPPKPRELAVDKAATQPCRCYAQTKQIPANDVRVLLMGLKPCYAVALQKIRGLPCGYCRSWANVAAKRLPVREEAPDWTLPEPPRPRIMSSIAPIARLSDSLQDENVQACVAAIATRIASIEGACDQLSVVWHCMGAVIGAAGARREFTNREKSGIVCLVRETCRCIVISLQHFAF